MAMCNPGRKRGRTASRLALAAGVIAALHAAPALAYLDPGTGSIILQGLLAGVAMVAAAGSMFWNRIKSVFSSLFSRKSAPATEPGQESEN